MKWRPFSSGVPYTCNSCPAYVELQAELDRWKKIAERLARWGAFQGDARFAFDEWEKAVCGD